MSRSKFATFHEKPKDKTYNTFISKRIPDENKILFQIERVLSKRKKGKQKTFYGNLELKDLIKSNGKSNDKPTTGKIS